MSRGGRDRLSGPVGEMDPRASLPPRLFVGSSATTGVNGATALGDGEQVSGLERGERRAGSPSQSPARDPRTVPFGDRRQRTSAMPGRPSSGFNAFPDAPRVTTLLNRRALDAATGSNGEIRSSHPAPPFFFPGLVWASRKEA